MVLLLLHFVAVCQQPYAEFDDVSSDALLEAGNDYMYNRNMADSALLYYSVVASRFSHDIDKKGKQKCIDGMLGKWQVYFVNYNDYKEAFNCLYDALEISQEIGVENPMIDYYFGNMYMDLYIQTSDSISADRAYDYYSKAYWLSLTINNDFVIDRSFSNLILLSLSRGSAFDLMNLWDSFRSLPRNSVFRRCIILLYEGCMAEQHLLYDKAIGIYGEILGMLDDSFENARLKYMVYTRLGSVYISMGNYRMALKNMEEPERITLRYGLTDARLQLYHNLSVIYAHIGDRREAERYKIRYYDLKDTLLNYQQLRIVGNIHFANEMRRADNMIEEMKERHRMQVVIIKVIVAVAAIIVFFVIVLYCKNKQLKRKNMVLYENTRERVVPQQKPKTAVFSDTEKADLKLRIESALEDVEKICSMGFSAEQLAEAMGCKQRNVSQAISEIYGCNFNILLNRYRIREAIRRIDDEEHYGNFTIEGIAQSIGMKSRTTFVSSFKQVTGLTPSEYIKINRSDKK